MLTISPLALPQLIRRNNLPIVLMSEYNFPSKGDPLIDQIKLSRPRYQDNCLFIKPTGLGDLSGKSCHSPVGIFLEQELLDFQKEDTQAVEAISPYLEFIKPTLFKSYHKRQIDSLVQYIADTNVAVNYSHDNAERFLKVHSLVASPDKQNDVVMMGENIKEIGTADAENTVFSESHFKDYYVLVTLTDKLIQTGFSKVVYCKLSQPQREAVETTLAENFQSQGPIYRLIHTGNLTLEQSLNLRKLGGELGGATGDQSASECLARTSMMVYELFSWKNLSRNSADSRVIKQSQYTRRLRSIISIIETKRSPGRM